MSSYRYCVVHTLFGWLGLSATEAGINRLILPKDSADDVLELLGAARDQTDDNAFADLPYRLQRYFAGDAISFDDMLDLGGASRFQVDVWRAAQLIPHGQTRSYRWIAENIGRPQGARAVGQALGANQIPILIPCHRVIAASGNLGGFSSGTDIKQALIDIERKSTNLHIE